MRTRRRITAEWANRPEGMLERSTRPAVESLVRAGAAFRSDHQPRETRVGTDRSRRPPGGGTQPRSLITRMRGAPASAACAAIPMRGGSVNVRSGGERTQALPRATATRCRHRRPAAGQPCESAIQPQQRPTSSPVSSTARREPRHCCHFYGVGYGCMHSREASIPMPQ